MGDTLVIGAASPMIARSWEPAQSYPDPAIRTLDPRFDAIKPPFNAAVERLATGFRWAEGPVWFGDGRYLLWSDIPNNRMMRWDEETGACAVFRKPSNHSNGNTRDRHGRLVTCEHEGRRVIRTEYDGSITVILDHYDGKRLNSPNDVVVKSDDSIWFTDPPFGILGNYEGERSPPELPTNVYRVDGKTGQAAVVAGDINGPNGLCFSPDEMRLYVVELRAVPRQIRVFDVVDDGSAGQRPGLCQRRRGHPGRLSLRCARQSVVRLGDDARRSTGLSCSRRTRDDRPNRIARALRQPVLWRAQTKSAVHGRQPVDLRGLCQHRGRRRRLNSAAAPSSRRGTGTLSVTSHKFARPPYSLSFCC